MVCLITIFFKNELINFNNAFLYKRYTYTYEHRTVGCFGKMSLKSQELLNIWASCIIFFSHFHPSFIIVLN